MSHSSKAVARAAQAVWKPRLDGLRGVGQREIANSILIRMA
jgi:hypothetical protein